MAFHPLGAEQEGRHEYWVISGSTGRRRTMRLLSKPPFTFPFDLLVPPVLPRADAWVAMNNLQALQALGHRAAGRVGRVAYYAIDFVPDRFGAGSALTRAYDALDRLASRRADVRFEVSAAALAARSERLQLDPAASAPAQVVPIGTNVDPTLPTTSSTGGEVRRAVWVGHMVERMGLDRTLAAIAELARRGEPVALDVVGHGPLEDEIREQVANSPLLAGRVTLHGFVGDQHELRTIVARSAVALAPYSTRVDSFTRFADPSKLKLYAAAGLPIVLTDVPPNAAELERDAGARVVADDTASVADAIAETLADPSEWRRRRAAALEHAQRFTWPRIVDDLLPALGLQP